VVALVQAGRGRVCWARYEHGPAGLTAATPYAVSAVTEMADQIEGTVLFAGEILASTRATLAERLGERGQLLPPALAAQPPVDEPDSLDELLAAADRAIGVRLGRRGADKGAWGVRAAALVGVAERGGDEPDWRGDVEIKTVPVTIDASGLWRVVEDPAIAMAFERAAIAKLQRTLWLARADLDDGEATIVSWYLLEWDARLAQLARRYLHDRPKGPAGTDQRGVYLHKRFFADAGLLATLNGPE
jgi:hypothetical protein